MGINRISATLFTAFFIVFFGNQYAFANLYRVENTNADGTGSLYQAITDANNHVGFDTIVFSTNVRGTIKTELGLPEITESLIIYGPGAELLAIDPGLNARGLKTDDFSNDSLFVYNLSITNADSKVGAGAGIFLDGGKTIFINCKIVNNHNSYGSAGGGGVYIFGGNTFFYNCEISHNTCYQAGAGIAIASGSIVYIYNSSISNNTILSSNTNKGGGGIYNVGDTYIENSTISGNSHPYYGGGIFNLLYDRNIHLNHVTISDNSAETGGGIYNKDQSGTDTIWMKNTIISGNTASLASNNIWGEFISEGNNLIEDTLGAVISGEPSGNIYNTEAKLGALTNYSYATSCHPLKQGSRAIDGAKETTGLLFDQIGNKRIIDGDNNGTSIADIGAVEYIIDTDFDGIGDKEEQGPSGADENYDGNNDGLPDKLQQNVTSLKNYNSNYYVTLASPENTKNVRVIANESPNSILLKSSNNTSFDLGYFSLRIDSIHKADNPSVDIFLPDDIIVTSYYNFGPTEENACPMLYEFLLSEENTGAEFEGNKITLHFQDGKTGDHDLTENKSLHIYGGPMTDNNTAYANLKGNSVLCYPNPFSSIIYLQLPDSEIKSTSVSIYNTDGRKVVYEQYRQYDSDLVRINGTAFPNGIYYYQIISGERIYTGKLIKLN